MAETAVDILMEKLKQLMKCKIDLVRDEKDQFESLLKGLRFFRSFLKDWEQKLHEPKKMSSLVARIRDVANQAEDTIDLFVVNASLIEMDIDTAESIDPILNLCHVKEEIEVLLTELVEIYYMKSCETEPIQQEVKSSSGYISRANALAGGEIETVEGFDNEAMKLKERLVGEQKQLDIVSIVGMPGIGKTTLARKVYNDPLIVYHFYIRAWITVSQGYQKRDLLLGLLHSFGQHRNDICGRSDEELSDDLRKRLKGQRYFIVMDDIWDTKAWDDLKNSFPNDNNGSRIMFTTRFTEISLHANPSSPPLSLRFLTKEESWDLFRHKVFQRETCPPDLEWMGKKIATNCQGLPLAIIVVSGILANIEKRADEWEKIGKMVNSRIVGDTQQCKETLALSYNHLPHHLKPCFLYFAAFPEDFEISVRKLTWLWVAEGFVRRIGEKSLEDVAEEYLNDLIGRNLILVSKRRSNGGIKACSIHDLLRDFCLQKAEEEYFFQKINKEKLFSSAESMRRLGFDPDIFQNTFALPSGLNTRSYLWFTFQSGPFNRFPFVLSRCFRLLRVLHMGSIPFSAYPSEIEQLVLLRYLALAIEQRYSRDDDNFTRFFPDSISNLWNLETLIVHFDVFIKLPPSILKMVKLRHICVSGRGKFRIGEPCGNDHFPLSLDNLQTLSEVDPFFCNDFLARTPNLKRLVFKGDIALCLELLMFPDISFLNHLQKLKLINQPQSSFTRSCDLGRIKFPPNLKQLTLCNISIKWDEMSTLAELLPNLEVLKLLGGACKGGSWETSWVFPQLKFLKLRNRSFLDWKVSGDHFPSLQRLVLDGCLEKKIPSEIGDVPTLQMIEVRGCNHSLAESARRIKEEQESMGNNLLQIDIIDLGRRW